MPMPARRFALPLILAALGVAAVAFGASGPALACVWLFCPGWGLTRLLSVADRNFGIFGSALCLSVLLLGLAPRLPIADEHLAVVVAGVSVVLCATGTLRIRAYDRWLREVGPPNDPMSMWPARTPMCVALTAVALVGVLWARPLGSATLRGDHLEQAALAFGWLRGENPFVAGLPLPDATIFSAAAATLSSATRLHPIVCVALISIAMLAAVLAFVAEGISRLWGNRGGTRAMLAFLIGMNPLGTFFMLGARDIESARAAMSPSFDDGISTALQPFVDGAPLCATLGFVAMMQSCTLSILRRSSTHIPRLLGVSTFALVLASPSAAMLLVPGWIVGIGLAHIMCLGSTDNDPQLNSSVRRPGEPVVLRSPFWRPVLHMLAGLAAAWWLSDVPDIPPQANVRPVTWALLSAIGPTCLLFMPGIRHLNASPGREAYFFVGLVTLTVTLLLTFDVFGDRGNIGVRLLSLLLAVPCANGAMKMIEVHGTRARIYLTLLVLGLLPATAIVLLSSQRTAPVALVAAEPDAQMTLTDESVADVDGRALDALRSLSESTAIVALPEQLATRAHVGLAALVVDRSLFAQGHGEQAAQRQLLIDRLHRGDATSTWALVADPVLIGREIFTADNTGWPGFDVLSEHEDDGMLVQRARRGDVVIISADRLAVSDFNTENFPNFGPSLGESMVFEQAVTPSPSLATALSVMMGAQIEGEDARDLLPSVLVDRGGRAAAWLALTDDTLDDDVRRAFGSEWHVDAAAPMSGFVDAALTWLGSEGDARSDLAWIHVGDVSDPEARVELDNALSRLLASLPADSRLVITSARGVVSTTAPAVREIPRELTESSLRVPLVIYGGGAPATRTTRLVSLADIWHLLSAGAIPERTTVPLVWDDPSTGKAFRGVRSRNTKTVDMPSDADGQGAGTWTVDLTVPFDERSPSWTPAPAVSSASNP